MIDARLASKKLKGCVVQELSLDPGSEILTARSATVQCKEVVMGDVVVYEPKPGDFKAGYLYFHVKVDGALLSCISEWPVHVCTDNFAKCLVQDEPLMMLTSCVREPCAYWDASAGQFSTVLLPPKVKHSL